MTNIATRVNYYLYLLALIIIITVSTPSPAVAHSNFTHTHLKKIGDFINCKSVKPETEISEVCYLKDDNKKYLIKYHADITGAVNEVAASFILRKISNSHAPTNYMVELDNGKFAVASMWIKNFRAHGQYIQENVMRTEDDAIAAVNAFSSDVFHWPQEELWYHTELFKKLCYSKNAVEASLLANFIHHQDYHDGNVGYISDETNEMKNFVVIDFDQALFKVAKK